MYNHRPYIRDKEHLFSHANRWQCKKVLKIIDLKAAKGL